MKKWLLPSILVLTFLSCKKEDDLSPGPVPAESRQNVSYGTDPRQTMDYYLPPGRSTASTRVIILVHGGAWSQGDKSDFTSYMDTLKRRLPSYAIFNINYRLVSGANHLFPTQENDVKAAVEFIYNKRGEFLISDKFVMLGASAGAHLSLLHSYKYTTPVKIRAVVDFFGPADLVDMYNFPASILAPPSLLVSVVGGTPTTHAALYHDSSPVNFVNVQSPPTIILQGGLDPLVAPSQSAELRDLLQASGVVHQYVFYPTEFHGWAGASLVDSFDRIQAFLEANVN
jgi:acetyl esterase/lipase